MMFDDDQPGVRGWFVRHADLFLGLLMCVLACAVAVAITLAV